ncbi:MAG: DUF1592 domain-containing protein [Nannocystaceae bacterium]|nr:DUF1592 domain-containing protein [bacterium]
MKSLGGLASVLLALAGCYTGASAGSNGDADTDDPSVAESGGDPTGSNGEAGDSGEPADPAATCLDELEPRALRRLSPEQAQNTVRDLFGVPDLEIPYGDESDVITELGVRQLRGTAEAVLGARDAWTADVYGCDTSGPADDACAETFIREFGAKAFRRPLGDAEVDLLMSVYESTVYGEQLSYADGLDVVLTTMLQSPGFIYVMESGTPVEGASGTVLELDGHSLASRLSYFLWNSMPDDALFAAAESGELNTPAGLEAQVERMLQSPRAQDRIRAMVTHWLHIDGAGLRLVLEELAKEPDLYPEFSPALLQAMRIEVEALVDKALFDDDAGGFEVLMSSREAYVNASLAELYGVQGPADDESWAWVTLPEEERSGLLTRAAFLSVHAHQRVQSPIYRGVYVLEEILCAELGEPPPTANDTPVEDPPDNDPDAGEMTIREMVELRTMNDATCATCHALINPTGYLFEHYDALGRWRSHEVQSGLEVDAAAELTMGDVAGPMPDATTLSKSLVESDDARACFAKKWAQTALDTHTFDPCTEEEVVGSFVQSGDVGALLNGIVGSPAFRYVRVEEEE